MNLKPWPRNPAYTVSDCGKVFKEGKERKVCLDTKGYYGCNLPVNGRYGTRKVHQMVLETFVGPKPEGMQTRHLNGVRTDNRLENLKWGDCSREHRRQEKSWDC
ncbi:MAG: HNH endonuclease signature motif containing protein [Betaproteobacteria bacterium]